MLFYFFQKSTSYEKDTGNFIFVYFSSFLLTFESVLQKSTFYLLHNYQIPIKRIKILVALKNKTSVLSNFYPIVD